MLLSELSAAYGDSADRIAARLRDLREAERRCADPEQRECLHRRILDLQPMLRQCRELQQLTAHYYDRGYHHDGKYCL